MQTKYLIIGNSVAGVNCIEAIRQIDSGGKIVLVSDEGLLNYSRPLISYYLGNKIPKEKISFRDESFYRENKVRLLSDTRAERIAPKTREVFLSKGRKVKYEKLLIATGGSPIFPPIEDLDKVREGIFTFTGIKDVENLIGYIEENKIKEAIVLGAGLIGLKCTDGLVGRNVCVTITELAHRILANTFDETASEIIEESLKSSGCNVIKQDTIVKVIPKNGRLTRVILKSGKEIRTNLLIIAIGVRPNLDLIQGTPIKYEKGIIVDDYMQTNIKGVYSAGDVAQAKELLSRENSVIAIWPVAARQGKIAGSNMAGVSRKYEGSFIMNSIELAGVPTISFGITNPEDDEKCEVLSREDKEKKVYRKVVLRNNRIVGAIFLGNIERAGIFSGLIRDKINVSSFKEDLLSDEFGFLVLPAEYRKHLVIGEGIEV